MKRIIGDEFEVSVTVKSGKYYRSPDKSDQLFYKEEDLIHIRAPPEPVGSRTRSYTGSWFDCPVPTVAK